MSLSADMPGECEFCDSGKALSPQVRRCLVCGNRYGEPFKAPVPPPDPSPSKMNLAADRMLAHLNGHAVGTGKLFRLTGVGRTTGYRALAHLEQERLIEQPETGCWQRRKEQYDIHE